MLVVENECVVCIDCDDTLVMWSDQFSQPHEGATLFIDPYDNSYNFLKINEKHVALLKKYKGRGYHIKVWSAAGYRWAEAVVRTLGIVDYVDTVETKPLKYVDDLTAEFILGTRVYLK